MRAFSTKHVFILFPIKPFRNCRHPPGLFVGLQNHFPLLFFPSLNRGISVSRFGKGFSYAFVIFFFRMVHLPPPSFPFQRSPLHTSSPQQVFLCGLHIFFPFCLFPFFRRCSWILHRFTPFRIVMTSLTLPQFDPLFSSPFFKESFLFPRALPTPPTETIFFYTPSFHPFPPSTTLFDYEGQPLDLFSSQVRLFLLSNRRRQTRVISPPEKTSQRKRPLPFQNDQASIHCGASRLERFLHPPASSQCSDFP